MTGVQQASEVVARLRDDPKRWLVTGVAGFIGSALLERLLLLGQTVVGVDTFVTGYRRNIDDVLARVGGSPRHRFIEGDIRDLSVCRGACANVDVVLHQAALGSVPRSIANPLETNDTNVSGFLNVLVAARDSGVKRFVYATSSSTYGDHPGVPKREDRIGRPLSPYAVTKCVNELYAEVFHRAYGIEAVGLRYFNVFGRRQDPQGQYAAVIPLWIGNLLRGEPCIINGDGETSRDFCYVDNVVQANLLAATAPAAVVAARVYNIGFGQRTTLNELFALVRELIAKSRPGVASVQPRHGPFRAGDIKDSIADVTRAREELGYSPEFDVRAGMERAVDWYVANATEVVGIR